MQSALITGASSGIGENLAIRLSQRGYKLFLLGRDKVKLEAVQKQLSGPSKVLSIDLLEENFLDRLQVLLEDSDFKQNLKLLVNNAGEFQRKSFLKLTSEDFRRQYRLQVEVPALLAQFCYEYMRVHKEEAAIVNVSSTLGLRPVAHTADYSAAKAAMISLTKSLAIELAPVRVNCVCPGIVDTPIHKFTNQQIQDLASLQLLGRVGTADDISESIAFLGSISSKWTTGSVLTVDGGIGLKD